VQVKRSGRRICAAPIIPSPVYRSGKRLCPYTITVCMSFKENNLLIYIQYLWDIIQSCLLNFLFCKETLQIYLYINLLKYIFLSIYLSINISINISIFIYLSTIYLPWDIIVVARCWVACLIWSVSLINKDLLSSLFATDLMK
jgi:hypothetical protein